MPITELTQEPGGFVKLGNIRKGEKDADGNMRDLSYFRTTFLPGKTSKRLQEVFNEIYGERPQSINIRFVYPDIKRVWDANYEAYKKGGLYFKAGSTKERGPYWIFYRDSDTAEVHISGSAARTPQGADILAKPLDLAQPVYFTEGKKEPVYMTPVGRLEVSISELMGIDVGYFEFRPESPRDIRNISAELNAYASIAAENGRTLLGVPFYLFRREEEVPAKIGRKMVLKKSWVVHLGLSGNWGQAALERLDRLALPEIVEGEVTDLATIEHDSPVLEPDPAEYSDEPEPAPDPVDGAEQSRLFSRDDAAETVDPMGGWSVRYAAEKWGCQPTEAAKKISAAKLPKPIEKSAFLEFVRHGA